MVHILGRSLSGIQRLTVNQRIVGSSPISPAKIDDMNNNLVPFTEIIKTIELIKTSFPEAEKVFRNGSCIKLAMILKHIYPEGIILYDDNHAIFEYGGQYYDIGGFAVKNENHIPLEDYGLIRVHELTNL